VILFKEAEKGMKILFCNYEYPPLGGGGGVMNALLAQELAKRHEVTVLTSQGMGLPRDRLENGVRVVRVPIFFRRDKSAANMLSMFAYIPGAINAGRKLLRNNQFDLINTHFVLPTGPVGDALARYAGIPNILSLHGGDLYDPTKFTSPHRHPLLRSWIKWLLHRADFVVGQSRNTLLNLSILYAPDIEAVRIPLGVRLSQVKSSASRHEFGFANDDFVMVTVGRLIRRKAVHQLLAVMAVLRHYKVRLVVVGSGPEETFLRSEAQRKHLEDKVRFAGYVSEEEKYRILNMSDIYVSTTQHEGFCLSFLEAMMAGLPIVTYDYGGHTDFLRDQISGYLVPLNNLDEFINRCKLLMREPSLHAEIKKNNQRRVKDYHIEICALRYEAVFSQALALEPKMRRAKVSKSPSASFD
jgi:glycosyltransferase involved in cell wall biosynthesis